MIKIRTDLYGTDDTIVRPVVETVIRDVLTMLGIDKEIPTRFEQGGLIKKKTKKGAVVSINAPLSELIEIEYNETGADNNDLSLHLVRPDQLPFYRDPEVFTSILPITLKRKCTLVFKYFDKSKSRVSAIANDLRMKPALDNCYRLHDLEYNSVLPGIIVELLDHINTLKNKRLTIPVSFEEYIRKHFDSRLVLTLPKDNVIQKYDMGIREAQLEVQGYITGDLAETQIQEDTEKGMWYVEFNYEFHFDKPIALLSSYPLLIFNNLIDKKFRNFINDKYVKSKKAFMNYGDKDIAKMKNRLVTNLMPNPGDYLRLPSYDTSILQDPPSTYKRLFSLLILVDPNNKRYLGNIKNVSNKLKLKDNIIKFLLESEREYVSKIHQSIFLIELYRNFKIDKSNPVILMENGDMFTTHDMDIKSLYHVSFSLLLDLDTLTHPARERLKEFIRNEIDFIIANGGGDNLINSYLTVFNLSDYEARSILDSNMNPGDMIFKISERSWYNFKTKQVSMILTGMLEERG